MYTTITRKRYAAGSFVNGTWVNGTETQTQLIASVQPAKKAELELLPEAERTKGAMRVYAEDVLRTANEANGTAADRIVWDGEDWEVQLVDVWTCGIAHSRSIVVRVER